MINDFDSLSYVPQGTLTYYYQFLIHYYSVYVLHWVLVPNLFDRCPGEPQGNFSSKEWTLFGWETAVFKWWFTTDCPVHSSWTRFVTNKLSSSYKHSAEFLHDHEQVHCQRRNLSNAAMAGAKITVLVLGIRNIHTYLRLFWFLLGAEVGGMAKTKLYEAKWTESAERWRFEAGGSQREKTFMGEVWFMNVLCMHTWLLLDI